MHICNADESKKYAMQLIKLILLAKVIMMHEAVYWGCRPSLIAFLFYSKTSSQSQFYQVSFKIVHGEDEKVPSETFQLLALGVSRNLGFDFLLFSHMFSEHYLPYSSAINRSHTWIVNIGIIQTHH